LSCSLRTRLLGSLLSGMMVAVPLIDATAADEGSVATQGETPTVTSAPSEPSAQASVPALATTSVEELVSIVRDSIVTIRHTG